MRRVNLTLLVTACSLVLAGLSPAAEPSQVRLAAAETAPKGDEKEADEGHEPGALTAFADADESDGEAPLTVQLDVDIIDGTGYPPFKFIWDFGDATEFSREKAPKHVYKIPGSFRASVIVTDSKGEIDQDFYDITVDEPDEPGAVTAEQLMQMMPPSEVAPELADLSEQIHNKGKRRDGKK